MNDINDLSKPTRINTHKSGYEGQGIVETYSDEPGLHYTRKKNGQDHWTLEWGDKSARFYTQPGEKTMDSRVEPPQY